MAPVATDCFPVPIVRQLLAEAFFVEKSAPAALPELPIARQFEAVTDRPAVGGGLQPVETLGLSPLQDLIEGALPAPEETDLPERAGLSPLQDLIDGAWPGPEETDLPERAGLSPLQDLIDGALPAPEETDPPEREGLSPLQERIAGVLSLAIDDGALQLRPVSPDALPAPPRSL